MTKEEHIAFWLTSADKEKDMMLFSFEGKRYVYALFFGHLYMEKILKSLWVKSHAENIPPKTHNLIKLLDETGIVLNDDDRSFLLLLNQYQIESRYPDDIEQLYKITDGYTVEQYFLKIKSIEQCLLNNQQ